MNHIKTNMSGHVIHVLAGIARRPPYKSAPQQILYATGPDHCIVLLMLPGIFTHWKSS